MTKLHDAFTKSPAFYSPMARIITSRVPDNSEVHKERCEITTVEALKQVLEANNVLKKKHG